MKMAVLNPAGAPAPFSRYAQAVAVEGASRWVVVSGQVGVGPVGTLAGDTRAQMRRAFENIRELLADAEMDLGNLVKLTAFLTREEDVGLYREVRDEMLGGHVCASTLLVISALAHPDWTVEIEALAAA